MPISKYEGSDGSTLYAVYFSMKRDPHRAQRRAQGFTTEREAKREEKRLQIECEREISEKERLGSTWGAMVDAFDRHLHSPELDGLSVISKLDYVAAIRKHTKEFWGRSASSLTPVEFKELFSQLRSTGMSVGHLKKIKGICNRIFEFGIERRLIRGIECSPLRSLSVGSDEEKSPEILNLQEIRKLLETARSLQHAWYPIWALALLTGMRNGELYALEWSDIDWENQWITVSKSYNCRIRAVKSTKAGYWRRVPMSSELWGLLEELRRQGEGQGFVLPRFEKWTRGLQALELRKFCSGMGLPSVRFHALRACFATQLIRNGVPPIQIQKICGWRDLKTMQRYIRLAGIEIEGATEKLKVLPDSQALELAAEFFQPAYMRAQPCKVG